MYFQGNTNTFSHFSSDRFPVALPRAAPATPTGRSVHLHGGRQDVEGIGCPTGEVTTSHVTAMACGCVHAPSADTGGQAETRSTTCVQNGTQRSLKMERLKYGPAASQGNAFTPLHPSNRHARLGKCSGKSLQFEPRDCPSLCVCVKLAKVASCRTALLSCRRGGKKSCFSRKGCVPS